MTAKTKRQAIIFFSILLIWFAILFIYIIPKNNESTKPNTVSNDESTTPSKTEEVKALDTESKKKDKFFQLGMEYYNSGSYINAIENFEKVEPTDSNFAIAQLQIKNSKEHLRIREKEEKEKSSTIEKYKNKYEKLMNAGLYLYEIEERLHRDDFYMKDSKYEKAPDGSDGVRQYFTKKIDGVTIDIWLQNAYSISRYYTDVNVY